MSMLTKVEFTTEEFNTLRDLTCARYNEDGSVAIATIIAKLSVLEHETDQERRVQALLADT